MGQKKNDRAPDPRAALTALGAGDATKIKVAVTDIDGVLRGKYLHPDKFASAVEGGFGFCDVVFGWDMTDSVYDNATVIGWQHGFPDALARLDLATARRVPWDDHVPFFLGDFVTADGKPYPICPRQTLKRVLARAEKLGFAPMCGLEFEWFNFAETPHSWAQKKGVDPTPLTPGMFGYSLLRANANRGFFNALMDQMLAFGVPIEGLHTETGPGVYEAAIQFSAALECADRGVLFKTGAKEIGAQFGIMPSFMAKWSEHYPGCSGHVHQSLSDGKKNLFYDAKGRAGMSKLFESYLAGQIAALHAVRTDVLADDQQLQAAGRRLLGAGEADLGDRQPNCELPRDSRIAERRPASRRAAQVPTSIPTSRSRHYSAAGLHGIEKNLKLTAKPITGTNAGLGRHPACAALAEGDDRDLPAFRIWHVTGSAISSSTTSRRRESGNGASGRTVSPTGN